MARETLSANFCFSIAFRAMYVYYMSLDHILALLGRSMASNNQRITMWLSQDVRNRARRVAKSRGQNLSEFIREALIEAVERHERFQTPDPFSTIKLTGLE